MLCETREHAIAVSDATAPEHPGIHAAVPGWWHDASTNYGTIFLGPDAAVAYSDKAIGANHVLPTRGAVRHTSGVWVGSCLQTPTYQEMDPAAPTPVAEATAAISEAEGCSPSFAESSDPVRYNEPSGLRLNRDTSLR